LPAAAQQHQPAVPISYNRPVARRSAEVAVLKIREEQIHLLGLRRRHEFVERMLRHVAHEYPGEYERLSGPGARALVERAIDTGATHGMRTEGAVAVLIQLMVCFGAEFERSPDRSWGLRMLAHATLPGSLKARMMAERMLGRTHGRPIVPFGPQ
jgi:hypothetical protein